MYRYFIIYKPYRVLSQFSISSGKETLANYFSVPKDVYPVGRLDYDSEGLLILTNDPRINHQLLNPAHQHVREYYVQVEGTITPNAIGLLQSGVIITIDGKAYKTKPCTASHLMEAPDVPDRHPPIRIRKEIPDSWISIILKEGKNRQVRKMTAKVGYPTLRLIRNRIENLTIDHLQPGEMIEYSQSEIFKKLQL